MAHALVSHADLGSQTAEEAERFLNERVIPLVKQLPGFERGLWLRSEDGSTGMGILVFDSEEHAKAARDGMSTMRPADAPPMTGVALYGVTGLA